MQNSINWFEIPTVDFERAIAFYNTVLGIEVRKSEFMGEPQAFFPNLDEGVGGAIVYSERIKPSSTGTMIYLNAGTPDGLEQALSRVESNGGKVLMPKTAIGDPGFIGIIIDTEGNQIGLHAPL